MKPGFERILEGAADAIKGELAPFFETNAAAAGHASMIRLLMTAAAQATDREPDTLVSEIAAMRRLFETAADTLLPGDLCDRLREAADNAQPASYSISALTGLRNGLTHTLVELHAEVEEISAPWARAIEAQVWDILRMGADRRVLDNLPGV
jgi:hypothetical protein